MATTSAQSSQIRILAWGGSTHEVADPREELDWYFHQKEWPWHRNRAKAKLP